MAPVVNPGTLEIFGPPPPGINLMARQDQPIIGVSAFCTGLAIAAVVLRIWARRMQQAKLMADDYLMVLALLFTSCTLIVVVKGAKAGAGRHVWSLDPQSIADVFRLLYIYAYIYVGSVTFTKLSILFFYHRIFGRGSRGFRAALYFAGFLVVGYMISSYLTVAQFCHPVPFFWTQYTGGKGTCVNTGSVFFILTVLNMVCDLIILIVPIHEIMGLNMGTAKKIGVCIVMGLGGLVCLVSAVKIWAFYQFTVVTDIVWVQSDCFLLSSVEPAFGIFCACLPSLRPLYIRAKELLGKGEPTPVPAWKAEPRPAAGQKKKNTFLQFMSGSWGSTETESVGFKTQDTEKVPISQSELTHTDTMPERIVLVQSEVTQSSTASRTLSNGSEIFQTTSSKSLS